MTQFLAPFLVNTPSFDKQQPPEWQAAPWLYKDMAKHMVVLGWHLDSAILEVFSNISDSVIAWIYGSMTF